MKPEWNKGYENIRKIIKNGRIGAPQVCVISVNLAADGADLTKKMQAELALMTDVLQSEVDKEKHVSFTKPYSYGVVSREYKNGNIGRYTYTVSQAKENTQITVYATDGELRFDSTNGKIFLYPQVPDYAGEEYRE